MKEVMMLEQHYNLLKKHLCKDDSRHVLQYIHNSKGYAYAADGKRLVKIKDAFHDLPDGLYMPMNTPKKSRTGIVTVIMKEGVDIQFPDCNVIWPKDVIKHNEKIGISQEFLSRAILDIFFISGLAVNMSISNHWPRSTKSVGIYSYKPMELTLPYGYNREILMF